MADGDFEEQLRQEELAKDDDTTTGVQIRVDEDGTLFEFDPIKRAWFPKIDEDFLAQYQMNYGNSAETTSSSATEQTSDTPSQPVPESDTSDHADFYQSYYLAIERGDLVAGDSKAYYEFYVSYYKQKCADGRVETSGVSGDNTRVTRGNNDAEGNIDMHSNNQSSVNDSSTQLTNDSDMAETTDKPANVDFTPTGNKEYDDYWKHYFENCYQEPEDEGEKHAKRSKVAKQNANAAKKATEATWFEVDQKKNTSVYVSGLPPDITDDAFKEMMNKYGLIVCDPKTRQLKIKLYRDENGQPKGDGLCSFIKRESVDLVLQLLDGYKIGSNVLSVKQAEFALKGQFDATKKKKLTNKEKRRAKKQQEKLFEWRLEKLSGETVRKKHERIIIVKNLFTPGQFEKDATLIKKTKEDLQLECCKYGAIVKITIHDHHPEGAASVTFKMVDGADACREALDGRYLGRRLLDAKTWDGKTNYDARETAKEREKRLKKWAVYLEGGGDEKTVDKDTVKNLEEGTSQIENRVGDNRDDCVTKEMDNDHDDDEMMSSEEEEEEEEEEGKEDESCDNPVDETSSLRKESTDEGAEKSHTDNCTVTQGDLSTT